MSPTRKSGGFWYLVKRVAKYFDLYIILSLTSLPLLARVRAVFVCRDIISTMDILENKRVAIFIDGGNFYQRIRHDGLVPKGVRLDYVRFAEFLARGREISSKSYYIGIVRNHDNSPKSQKMVESQQKLLSGLEKDGYLIKRGKIVYDNKIREKGVDVQIAIDLVIGAVEDSYDVAIIVSSDTDLIPAIRYVRAKGKKVEYVGFSQAPSLGMIKESDYRILLLKEQLDVLE